MSGKPYLSRDEQIKITRKHNEIYKTLKKKCQDAMIVIDLDQKKFEFDQDLDDVLSVLHDALHGLDERLGDGVHDAEADIYETDVEKEEKERDLIQDILATQSVSYIRDIHFYHRNNN